MIHGADRRLPDITLTFACADNVVREPKCKLVKIDDFSKAIND